MRLAILFIALFCSPFALAQQTDTPENPAQDTDTVVESPLDDQGVDAEAVEELQDSINDADDPLLTDNEEIVNEEPVDGQLVDVQNEDSLELSEEDADAEESAQESRARFIPTEQISQDLGVSFPVDI